MTTWVFNCCTLLCSSSLMFAMNTINGCDRKIVSYLSCPGGPAVWTCLKRDQEILKNTEAVCTMLDTFAFPVISSRWQQRPPLPSGPSTVPAPNIQDENRDGVDISCFAYRARHLLNSYSVDRPLRFRLSPKRTRV